MSGADPELPDSIEDRAADCWEPLLAIADAAGADWPDRARKAAVFLTYRTVDEAVTSGVELLGHIREAFGDEDKIWTKALIQRLCDRDESPWKDIRGKELNDRGLATRLKPYGIKSRDVRIGNEHHKGFVATDFYDAWNRYLAPRTRQGRQGRQF